jgi:hypothetical protein
MNAAIPSTTNARMVRQTSAIATAIPADIVDMSIVMNLLPEMRPLRDLQLSTELRQPANAEVSALFRL